MFKHFYQFPAVLAMCLAATSGVADQAPNPRSAVSANTNTARNSSAKVMTRGDGTAASVVSRGGATSARATQNNVSARSAATKTTVARTGRATAVKQANMANRSATTSVRSATTPARAGTVTKANLGRSAVPGIKNNARSASKAVSNLGMARAANMARATAVFNDISKIGGGYGQCRDSYATCMDQFCANANDTFRRCYCSQKFTEFQETEATFEEIKLILQSFEDNELNAVDKTAAEVSAMYTATPGEAAIKKDVSSAAEKLNNITELLSGKKKTAEPKKQSTSLDFSSLSTGFSVDMDNLWGGGSVDSLFGGGSKRGGPNMAEMSGQELYNEANKQCLEITADSCTSNALLNMATSSYTIMITQDCNLYEKKLDAQRQAIQNTVREASKMLTAARLEEHRSHNSADVNECLSKVQTAMTMDTACGANYKRCLDPSGQYISPSTGEPIYSPLLFKLVEVINLYDPDDPKNTEFKTWLDGKRIYAETALDSCRGIADTVWSEFKSYAIIEIAQAQDEKIEQVKTSCVQTMADCYDKESGGLKNLDTTSAQSAGAIAANAARAMCSDKVAACAALYVPHNQAVTACDFNGQGQITNATKCGLGALLDYVATIDSTKIAEGCADAMAKYAQELCAPGSSDSGHQYPWGCRNMARHTLEMNLLDRAKIYCDVSNTADARLNADLLDYTNVVNKLASSITSELSVMLSDACETAEGIWIDAFPLTGEDSIVSKDVSVGIRQSEPDSDGNTTKETKTYDIYKFGFDENDDEGGSKYANEKQMPAFLSEIGVSASKGESDLETYGICMENSVKVQCDAIAGEENEYAEYDAKSNSCKLTDEWYKEKCSAIGGYFENDTCYYAGE